MTGMPPDKRLQRTALHAAADDLLKHAAALRYSDLARSEIAASSSRNAVSFSSACAITAFRYRDARQQSRLFALRNQRLI
jgi:hypothetical protein